MHLNIIHCVQQIHIMPINVIDHFFHNLYRPNPQNKVNKKR